MAAHVWLLLFSFGIWQLVWIYRATGFLNQDRQESPRNPTGALLLCLFVPSYWVYWMYKSAQRADWLSSAMGIPSDNAVLCLILALFVPIVPPILIQNSINSIARAPEI